MASIRTRVGKRRTTYRVLWRVGGTGRQDGETCDDYTTAKKFRGMVDAAGDHRPEGFPQGCRGIARITTEAAHEGAAAESAPEEPAGASTPTFAEVFTAYLDFLAELKKAEPRQVEGYRRLFDDHVRSAIVKLPNGRRVGPIGELPVEEITTAIVQAWVSWMGSRTYVYKKARKPGEKDERRPYSAKTIHNIHGSVISPVLGHAARPGGEISLNPCAAVHLPEKSPRAVSEEQVPMGEEIEMWISAAESVSPLAGDLVTVAMGTGMRWSEMIALRPCDVDLKAGLLTVNQVVKQDARRRNYIAPYGKSDAALRTLRIGKDVRRVLRRRTKDMRERGRSNKDLLFTAVHGGILRSSYWHDHHWVKVVAKMREEQVATQATAHKLRHAHATMLLARNVSMDTVSKRLGHASGVITSDLYSHREPEADKRAAEVLDTVMDAGRRRAKKKKAFGERRTPTSSAA